MRVSGFVRDADTGEPVSNCGVRVGEKYVHVDSAGHYVIKARFDRKTKAHFTAKGYEERVMNVDASKSRYPRVDVDMKRRHEPCPPGCVPADSAAAKK
jgi:hypothetical protein